MKIRSNVYHITYFPDSETACLYFKGCNFHCLGCIRRKCNFDIHLTSLKREEAGKKIKAPLTIYQILKALNKEKISKVVFMGGEPTIDSNLDSLAKKIKEKFKSFNVLLTNGYILANLSFFDEVCVGVKAKTRTLHKEYTGKWPKEVFKNLKILDKSDIVLRTESIFIPDYIDFDETECIAKAISRINPNIPHRIDGYIPTPQTKWRKPVQREIKKAADIARKCLNKVIYIKMSQRKTTRIKRLI